MVDRLDLNEKVGDRQQWLQSMGRCQLGGDSGIGMECGLLKSKDNKKPVKIVPCKSSGAAARQVRKRLSRPDETDDEELKRLRALLEKTGKQRSGAGGDASDAVSLLHC